jgi:hypothetical protein
MMMGYGYGSGLGLIGMGIGVITHLKKEYGKNSSYHAENDEKSRYDGQWNDA